LIPALLKPTSSTSSSSAAAVVVESREREKTKLVKVSLVLFAHQINELNVNIKMK
jgi:hypothetical protein